MNFREKLVSVFQKLGLTDKAKENALTTEEWKQVVDSYRTDYQSTLQDDLAAEQAAEAQAAQAAAEAEAEAARTAQAQAEAEAETARNAQAEAEAQAAEAQAAQATAEAEAAQAEALNQEQMNQVQAILNSVVAAAQPTAQPVAQPQNATVESINSLAAQVSQLVNEFSNQAAADMPAQIVQGNVPFIGNADQSQFLFGIESPMFAMNARHNRITTDMAYRATLSTPTDSEFASFKNAASQYAASLRNRYAYLMQNGMLNAERLAAGEFATDFQPAADIQNQFILRRQDAIIARVLQARPLPFPIQYGIQDHDLVISAIFDEVSQAYQEGEIYKGGMELQPEMGHVDDAMIKMKFGPMKKLERMYIGYLNREGSDPMKWSMIEFCIVNSLVKAVEEQNRRRVLGIYVNPEKGHVGKAINSSTGLVYTLVRHYHENKILLNDAEEYRSYTSANMLDAVKAFVEDVTEAIADFKEVRSLKIYLNANHRQWFIANCRAAYGKDTDFTGPNASVVPDTEVQIEWLPYMGNSCLMFMQEPGNISFLEYIPGEMFALRMKEDLEDVRMLSVWKEGCSASFCGLKFATPEALKENNFYMQQIFMNKPAFTVLQNATTLDAKDGNWFETVAGSASPAAITDIENAKPGVPYIIEAGGVSNLSKVAKAGKFDQLVSAWTPTQAGDYLMVILNHDGSKFLELERAVGGVRSVNELTQPNLPGVR